MAKRKRQFGSLAIELVKKARELQRAVSGRLNILISGGTGTGKTTLLNALAAFVQNDERVVVIEDTSEIQIEKPNVTRFEARHVQQGLPAVTIRMLLKAALRMRPDRILLGEGRGEEAFDLLQAMNTGHSGSLSTIHASSGSQTLTRFATCVMMSGIELPHRTVRANIAEALTLLIHLDRRHGKRAVSEVLRVNAYDSVEDQYDLETVYTHSVDADRPPIWQVMMNYPISDDTKSAAALSSPERRDVEYPITVRDAARYLGVSPQTVYLWVERKQIPHLRVMGRNIRFLKSDLEPFRASFKQEVRNATTE